MVNPIRKLFHNFLRLFRRFQTDFYRTVTGKLQACVFYCGRLLFKPETKERASMDLLTVAAKLLLSIFLILIYINISGKSQLAPLTASDQVGNIVLAALIGETILNADIGILEMIGIVVLWTVLQLSIRFVKFRSNRISDLIDGKRIQLVNDGEIVVEHFQQAKLSPSEFVMMLHQQEISHIGEVRNVWYEPSGKLTVDKKGKEDMSAVLISDGNVEEASLKSIEKDGSWLEQRLSEENCRDISGIFIAEWYEKKLWIYPYGDGLRRS